MSKGGRLVTVGDRLGSGAMAVVPLAETSGVDLDDDKLDVARKVLSVFLQLDREERELVCHILNNGTFEEYGNTNGMSKQAVSYRAQAIARKYRHFSFISQSAKVNDPDKPSRRP